MKKHWSTVLKTAVCSACAAAMVASQVAPAFAIGSLSKFEAPTSATTINKNVITAGAHTIGVGAEILGLNQVTEGFSAIDLASCEKSKFFGLFGTSLNQAADPYVANYFYNAYAAANGKAQTAALDALGFASNKPDRADLTAVAEYGNVSKTLAYRPDILVGCDPKSFTSGNVIKLNSSGKAVAAAKSSLATSGYTDMVNAIHGFKGTEFYKTGDENYDPYYVEFALWFGDASFNADGKAKYGCYSLYGHVLNEYRMAGVAEEISKENKAKTTRYADSSMQIAQKFEGFTRGLQLYLMAAIDAGAIKKKTIASVASVDSEAKTVSLYKSTDPGNVNCTDYDGTNGVSSNYIGYYTETVENVCDNLAGVRDANSTSMDGSGWSATVDAAELAKADVVILNKSADETALRALLSSAGIPDADMPQIYVPGSVEMTGRWYAENTQVVGSTLGFVYPEALNAMYATAYYFENFYHTKADVTSLSNAIGLAFGGGISLAPGVTDDLSGYSASYIDEKIQMGLWYYKQHKAEIDKNMPKLSISENLALPTADPAKSQTIKITKYASKTYKSSTLKKKKASFAATVSGAKGAVTATPSSAAKKAKITAKVNSSKKITVTVPKGCKAGTYKITVKAKASFGYKASASKTITVKVTK